MSEMVRKAKTEEIINHWILAGSCILLIITGYGFLFQIKGMAAVFGNFNVMRVLHNWGGVVFTISLLMTTLNYLRESITFTSDDLEWIKVGGGYLSRKHDVKIPPMGKLNTGQKAYYLAILIAGIGIAASGFAIWLVPGVRTLTMISHLIHNLCFDLFVIAVPVHAYLGSLANPGTFRIMVYGTVPMEFARKKYPKWMEEMGKK